MSTPLNLSPEAQKHFDSSLVVPKNKYSSIWNYFKVYDNQKIERSEDIAVWIICFQNYSQDMNSSSKKWEDGEGITLVD